MQKIEKIADTIIQIGFSLIVLLVPLLLTPVNYELFEYNKMMAVYGITALIIGAWVSKMLVQKRLFVARTPFDIPIVLFVLSQFISTLFSIDPHVSWFGYYSRFNGGMLSILCYVALFYACVTNCTKQHLPKFAKFLFSTACVVSIYGVLEHFGIDKHLWVQDVQSRVFSTLGQPNWLAAYVVALIPISLSIAYDRRNNWPQAILPMLVTFLYFLTLLYTKSRSGLVAFIVVDVLIWTLFIVLSKLRNEYQHLSFKQKISPVFVFHIILAIGIFFTGTNITSLDKFITFNGWKESLTKAKQEATQSGTIASASAVPTTVGPVLETGGTESGVIRKYVWQGAINAWKSSPKTILIGTGTETFAFAFYANKPLGHNTTSEWDFLYNKAHNEYLNYLATTGILGLGTYLFFLIVVFLWSINAIVKNQGKLTSVIGILLGWISILITNFFGFSVVITQLFLFLFPAALLIVSTTEKQNKQTEKRIVISPKWQRALITGTGVLTTLVIILLVLMWIADKTFATGYRLSRAGQYASAYEPLQTAVAMRPNEPLYHDEYANVLATLAVAAMDNQDATLGGVLANYAITENDTALKISPNNVNFWKSKTKIFYTLSTLDETLITNAKDALIRAETLSPQDPKITYNLAILEGRTNNASNAIEYLKHAILLKPNYRDAYYALYIFYTETNQKNEGKALITTYLTTINSQDEEFKKLVE